MGGNGKAWGFVQALLSLRAATQATYSQANTSKIPTRNSFAEAVIKAFNSGSAKVAIVHWCCSQESHKKSGVHYHMCLKLDRNSGGYGLTRFSIKIMAFLPISRAFTRIITQLGSM